MGEVELNASHRSIIIHSHIVTYGNAADEAVTRLIRDEIETMWNEPQAIISIKGELYYVQFSISAQLHPQIDLLEVYSNVNPRNNYFRIEEYAHGNISFVDGLGCNSGYFMFENLYAGSTTAAHEYGHTLGLPHPQNLDIRGNGQPSIMYPRGTLVDAIFQYDPTVPAVEKGGTLHPKFRKVLASDIEAIRIERMQFTNGRAVSGEFTNVFHQNHGDEYGNNRTR